MEFLRRHLRDQVDEKQGDEQHRGDGVPDVEGLGEQVAAVSPRVVAAIFMIQKTTVTWGSFFIGIQSVQSAPADTCLRAGRGRGRWGTRWSGMSLWPSRFTG